MNIPKNTGGKNMGRRKSRQRYDEDLAESREEGFFDTEDDDDDEDPGVYRSYSDYLISGEPVDPCKDALWLNDL